jgi:hypothetical protein
MNRFSSVDDSQAGFGGHASGGRGRALAPSRARLAMVAFVAIGCAPAAAERTEHRHLVQRVAIVGQHADTLGDTLEPPHDGHVLVLTHDGRELWIPASRLTTPTLDQGRWVLVAHEGGIFPAQILATLDDYVEVRIADVTGFAPMHAILALLHVPLAEHRVESASVASGTAGTALETERDADP